jgi:hypothetical protein
MERKNSRPTGNNQSLKEALDKQESLYAALLSKYAPAKLFFPHNNNLVLGQLPITY